jgi:hypothetical protein
MWALLAAVLAALPLSASAESSPSVRQDAQDNPGADRNIIDIRIPEYAVDEEDTYLCVAVKLPAEAKSIVSIVPHANQTIVHHMLLFGARNASHVPATMISVNAVGWLPLAWVVDCPGCVCIVVSIRKSLYQPLQSITFFNLIQSATP